MRVCYVSRECAPYTGGGIGTYIRNVIAAMAQAGHDVVLLSDFLEHPHPEQPIGELQPLGIQALVPDSLPADMASFYYHHNHAYADRVWHTLRRIAAEQPFDVIEFPEYRAEGFTCIRTKRLLNAFADTTLVVKCHTPDSLLLDINNEYGRSEYGTYPIYTEDYAVTHADVVTSPSQSLADYFQARLQRDDIQISRYPLLLPTLDQGSPTSAYRSIVYVGRIEWRKGVDLLIQAVAPLLRANPDVVLDCYGADTFKGPFESSMTEYLRRRCISADVADRVRLHGTVPYADVLRQIATAAVCVFPSRWENWPNVCLEAMSLGRAVVVSQHGGMREMVEDGISGFVVDPHDFAQVARSVQTLLDSPAQAQAFGQAAIHRAHILCDYAVNVRELEQCYARAHARTGSAATATERPRVSVIVPCYNQREWLNEAVQSALASTYENLEVIVVDDGSTDPASKAIFDALDDPRIKKVRKSNGGLSSARNAAIAAASGDYILPLDSDDKIHADYIAQAVQALLNNPELAYVTCYTRNFGMFDSYYLPVGLVRSLMLISNPAGKCTSLFRRAALEQVGGYDEYMISFEDWDVLCRLAATAWDGDVLPEIYFFYRRHSDSMVYQDALPKQLPLMQYMVAKNSQLLHQHADELVRNALNMWYYEYRARLHGIPQTQTQAQFEHTLLWRAAHRVHINPMFQRARKVSWHTRAAVRRLRKATRHIRMAWFTKPVDIVLRATGTHNPLSQGHEIWLLDVIVPNNEPLAHQHVLVAGDQWQLLASTMSYQQQALVATHAATLRLRVPADAQIRLLKHPWSGMLEIETASGVELLDLYASSAQVVTHHV